MKKKKRKGKKKLYQKSVNDRAKAYICTYTQKIEGHVEDVEDVEDVGIAD